jgi:hypothetical protein
MTWYTERRVLAQRLRRAVKNAARAKARISTPARDFHPACGAYRMPKPKPRAPLKFKQTDVSRAIRAAKAAGLEIASVRVASDGEIIIVPGAPTIKIVGEVNEWDAPNDKAPA